MRSIILLTTLILLSACAGAQAAPDRSPIDFVELVDSSCEPVAGRVELAGRITNTHPDRRLTLVRLYGTLYDAGGVEVSTGWGLASSPEIAPGARSSFRFFIDAPPDAAECSLGVMSAQFTR